MIEIYLLFPQAWVKVLGIPRKNAGLHLNVLKACDGLACNGYSPTCNRHPTFKEIAKVLQCCKLMAVSHSSRASVFFFAETRGEDLPLGVSVSRDRKIVLCRVRSLLAKPDWPAWLKSDREGLQIYTYRYRAYYWFGYLQWKRKSKHIVRAQQDMLDKGWFNTVGSPGSSRDAPPRACPDDCSSLNLISMFGQNHMRCFAFWSWDKTSLARRIRLRVGYYERIRP